MTEMDIQPTLVLGFKTQNIILRVLISVGIGVRELDFIIPACKQKLKT